MKKALLFTIALLFMLAPACKLRPATTVGGSSVRTSEPKTFVANITITYTRGATPNVIIKDEYPDPDDNTKKRNHLRLKWQDKVKWHVTYEIREADTPNNVMVTIGDFQRESPSGSADPPFSNIDMFDLNPSQNTPAERTLVSRPKHGEKVPQTFKYSITVRIAGLPEIKIDPRVVLDP